MPTARMWKIIYLAGNETRIATIKAHKMDIRDGCMLFYTEDEHACGVLRMALSIANTVMVTLEE